MRLYPQLAELRSRQVVRDVLVLLALVLFAVLAWAVRSAVMALTAISEGFTSGAAGAQETWGGVGEALAGIPFVGGQLQQTFEDLGSATFGTAAQTGQTVTNAVTTAANVLALVTFLAPAAVLLVLWLPRRLDRARGWDAGYRVLTAVPAPRPYALAPGLTTTDGAGTSGTDATGTESTGADATREHHDTLALPGVPNTRPPVRFASGGAGAATDPVAFPPDELLALRALCHLPFEDLVRYAPRPFEAFATGDHAPLVAALYAHEGMAPPTWSRRR
ncbi:MAG TPA: hypothetical protein VF143_11105 [Candidatus Nanopelagicales bacterium]